MALENFFAFKFSKNGANCQVNTLGFGAGADIDDFVKGFGYFVLVLILHEEDEGVHEGGQVLRALSEFEGQND